MSAPTKKAAPAKRSPRAVKRQPEPAAGPEITDEDLVALTVEPDDEPEPGSVRPVVIGKRGRRGDAPVELVTIFEVDDVEYGIPKNPSAAMVLSWLLDVQQLGMQQANTKIGMELLGPAPFAALKNAPETEPEDLRQIFENIGIVFFASENYRKIMEAPNPS